MKNFLDISEDLISDSVLIIDVDGTLVPNKNKDLSSYVVDKLKKLSKTNEIWLCSNGSSANAANFAKILSVQSFRCLKPFRGEIENIVPKTLKKIVIGDKYLTDGLFAKCIGANFIKIDHLRGETDSLYIKVTYLLDDVVWSLKNYFVLMRPWQWVKNLLVIAPVFFAGEFVDKSILLNVFWATVIFSVFASAMYVFNDILDTEKDKNHPKKKFRPLASGVVRTKEAWLLFIILVMLGSVGLYFEPAIIFMVLSYVALNIFYSILLKRVPVIDAISVALSYVLRVLVGGVATSTYVSPWIILCVFFGALFVVFGKRLAEFYNNDRRHVLNYYSKKILSFLFLCSVIATVIVYAVWSVFSHHSPYLIYSTVFVAVALFRVYYLIRKGNELGESPEILVFKDRTIFISFVVWLGYVSFVFYLVTSA